MKTIICQDAKKYLESQESIPSVITSLPDMEEVNMELDDWKIWFEEMVRLILLKLQPHQYAIFYQTDRKHKGRYIDKSYLCNNAAHDSGVDMIFHKIVMKSNPKNISLFRPNYTHLLCYSKGGTPQKATPDFIDEDVIEKGEMAYKNAMGLQACQFAVNFVKPVTDTILDPFCGMGSVLRIANDSGLRAIGVDIDPKMCEKAKK